MENPDLVVNLVAALGVGPLIGTAVGAYLARKSAWGLERQRRQLEKEYEVYAMLWDALFEMVRTIANVPLSIGSHVVPMEKIVEAFDAYQLVVRRSEPFVSDSVFKPARRIVTLGRKIFGNDWKIEQIQKLREKMDFETDQNYAEKQFLLDEESNEFLKEIEELRKGVLAAIRARIGE
jgi:tRNA-dihydrouridine synthase